MNSLGPDQRVLKQSKRRLVRSILVGLGFTAIGTTMILSGSDRAVGYMAVGLFGVIGLPIVVFQLARRPTLTLTAGGFEYVPGIKSRATSRTWLEVGEIVSTLGPGRLPLLVWNTDRSDHPRARRFNSWAVGGSESIPGEFDGITTDQAAALMNEFRTAALGDNC